MITIFGYMLEWLPVPIRVIIIAIVALVAFLLIMKLIQFIVSLLPW